MSSLPDSIAGSISSRTVPPEIFENSGRKVDKDRRRSEKDIEIQKLKEVIAEITQENLEIKKVWRSLGEGGRT